jgi:non-heme chloroperoxidase
VSTFKTTDGTEIYYNDWGQGHPVLFSHGWPLDGDMWEAQMFYLASRGYRAIAYDRRGFGRSSQPWQGYDYDTFADDLHQLVEHLNLDSITLVGFSMGGGDVVRYMTRHGSSKVAGLALLGSTVPVFGKRSDYPEGVDKSVFDGMKAGLVSDRAQFIADFNPAFYGPDVGNKVSAAVVARTVNTAMLASLKATIDCVTAFSETDFRPELVNVQVPSLVIHGAADGVAPFDITGKLTVKMISGCQLKLYEGASHAFPTTHADRVNEDLEDFLKQLYL